MAASWYRQVDNREIGPVPFRELVILVQEGLVNEDDLVRPHYSREWGQAYRVVGLFNMARRVPREILEVQADSLSEAIAAQIGVAELAASIEDQVRGLNGTEVVAGGEGLPARLMHRADCNDPQSTAAFLAQKSTAEVAVDEAATVAAVGGLRVAIDGAAAHLDQRTVHESWLAGRWMRLTRFWPDSRTGLGTVAFLSLRHSYRLALASLLAWGVSNWLSGLARADDQRFPGWSGKLPTKVLPVIGVCSPEEYAFYSWDIVLGAGVAAYCLATWMERHATDA